MTSRNPIKKKKMSLTRAWRAAREARSGIAPRGAACQSGSACGRWGRFDVALPEQKSTEEDRVR